MVPTTSRNERAKNRKTRRVEQTNSDDAAVRLEAVSGQNISVYTCASDGEGEELLEMVGREVAFRLRSFVESSDSTDMVDREGLTDVRMEASDGGVRLYSVYSSTKEDTFRSELNREVATAITEFAEEVF